MMSYGMPRRIGLFLLAALSALLVMPCPVFGATPPPLPSLLLSLSNDTLAGDEDLVVSAAWSRDASFYRPPQRVDLLVYSVSSGSLVAGYTLFEDDSAAAGDTVRHFRGTVPSAELPEGRLLLVALDPVSGAVARAPVDVIVPGPDYPGVQAERYMNTVFLTAAAILLAALGTALVLMLRRS